MVYTIKDDCIVCESCHPVCPEGAIKPNSDSDGYWIDPTLCNGCPDVEVPRCVTVCSVESLAPLQPKKGRCKSSLLRSEERRVGKEGRSRWWTDH